MYKKFLFVYSASFLLLLLFCKRFTSTKELNILLKQVSINVCKTLDWVVCPPLFSCYLGLFSQGCLNSSDPPQNSLLTEKTVRSAHKAVKSILISEQTKHHSSECFFVFFGLFFNLWLSCEKGQFITPPSPPPPPGPCLGVDFYALFKHIFFVILAFIFQKVAKIWNFWKVVINFCHSVNPLRVSSRHCTQQTQSDNVFWSRGTVLSDSAASLSGYVASTATPKK